jgi:type VI secretion system secreted protein Hcp
MKIPIPIEARAPAASDIFLHVQAKRAGKIKGEAVAADHKDDIVVTAWQWGVAAGSAIGSGQATARRSYKHLVVYKAIDSASTGLMSALATNDEIKEAKLVMCKSGDEQAGYFSITLGGARVTAIDIEVDAHGAPAERLEFSFTKVDVEYRRQQSGGQMGASSSFADEYLPA